MGENHCYDFEEGNLKNGTRRICLLFGGKVLGMAGPSSFEADERAFQVLAVILSEVPEGFELEGPLDKTLYGLLKDEKHPLIVGHLAKHRLYSYSPAVDDVVRKWILGGAISYWGIPCKTVEIKTPAYFMRASGEADFTSDEMVYLERLGNRLVRDFARR